MSSIPRSFINGSSFRGYVEVVKALLDKRADVNAKSAYGATGLMWAARRGQVDVVKLLKARGAKVLHRQLRLLGTLMGP